MPSFKERCEKLRANPDTACAGLPWLQDEDDDLLKEAAAKTPLDAIVKLHKRTKGSIIGRLKQHALKMHEQGIPFLTICVKLNMDIDIIQKHFEKMGALDKSASAVPEAQPRKRDQTVQLLEEIRDLLKVVVQKLT